MEMRRRVFWILALAPWLLSISGCNKDDVLPTLHQDDGGSSNGGSGGGGGSRVRTGGTTGKGGATANGGATYGGTSFGGAAFAGNSGSGGTLVVGGAGGGTATTPGAPLVEITAPRTTTAPTDPNVIAADSTVVTCHVSADPKAPSRQVDTSSVTIAVFDSTGKQITGGPAVRDGASENYTRELDLREVANGPLSFQCIASALGLPVASASTTIGSFVDHGPKIEIKTPTKNSAHALKGAVLFEFSVVPVALAALDPGSEVAASGVTLEVKGVTIPVAPKVGMAGTYQANVDFNNPTLFPQTPSGTIPVVIQATNQRTPLGVTKTYNYTFVIDGEGPQISVIDPPELAVVGGVVILKFKVTDGQSSVDTSSVIVTINDVDHHYDPKDTWSFDKTDTFTYQFDSATVTGSVTQIGINIAASDAAGNLSRGAAHSLYIDNQRPWISLDPPPFRERRPPSGATPAYCSNPFDPAGDRAPNDMTLLKGWEQFRAVIWEITNQTDGQSILHYAGTNQSSIQLYLQPDPSQPLLIDKDKAPDNYCDDLAIDGLRFQQLYPISPTGESQWGFDTDDRWNLPALQACSYQGSTAIPTLLCSNNSEMTRIVGQMMGTQAQPVVYGVGKAMAGPACTGDGWEISGYVPTEGWVCLAVRGLDNVNNVGISPPLRLCWDDPSTATHPPCATDLSHPPSCTDGCVLRPNFPLGGKIIDRP